MPEKMTGTTLPSAPDDNEYSRNDLLAELLPRRASSPMLHVIPTEGESMATDNQLSSPSPMDTASVGSAPLHYADGPLR